MIAQVKINTQVELTKQLIEMDTSLLVDGVASQLSRRTIELEDEAVRRALTQMGWTPPGQAASTSKTERTDAQIVDQTEELARLLIRAFFRSEKANPLLPCRDSTDFRVDHCWRIACEIQELLTGTDAVNAAQEVDAEKSGTPPVIKHLPPDDTEGGAL